MRVARKHIGWYLKGRPDTQQVLYDLMRVQTAKEQLDLIQQHFLKPTRSGPADRSQAAVRGA